MKCSKHSWCGLILLLLVTLTLGACAPDPVATALPAPTAVPVQPTATSAAAAAPTLLVQPTATSAAQTVVPTLPVQPTVTAAAQAVAPTAAPAVAGEAASWQADGAISPGEYAHQETFGQVTLAWRNDADYLYLAMSGKGEGWIAVGIDPLNRMQGSDFILGYVDGGVLSIFDAFGQGPAGPTHPQDTEIGGSDDIVAAGGVEVDGVTTIEFQKPLDSGDEFDKVLTAGQTVKVLVALGRADEFNSLHSFRGAGTLVLD